MARELHATVATRGYLAAMLSDGGTELISNVILACSQDRAVGWHYIALGRRELNGYVETFNCKLRMNV